ncbi:hypothetical protein L227DRAFT_608405 [Lentinus tigrinus ALCF2SS1-6]|uniref:BTB domain-containing protein n=1 Tax=Lentinus tigrinus ALCF2SS1-6 TaxID=1328759 RepID=A0A5C2SL33_9APHY|nr:hypothetical protein L227DRAFT_608405 [Lentinus tigrinus ALCF2SS1-6]
MPLEQQTKVALEQSLTSGIFIDARFYLFTRRRRDGSVYAPLPIYAHSNNLTQTASYFKSLFCGGFVEDMGKETSLDPDNSIRTTPASADKYGYDSDSDLEDDEILSPSGEGWADDTPEPPETSNLKSSASVADGPTSSNQEVTAESSIGNPYSSSYGGPLKRIPIRYSVVVGDIAFKTFRALVYYAYTGEVTFALCVPSGKLPPSLGHARRSPAPQNLCTVLPISTTYRH